MFAALIALSVSVSVQPALAALYNSIPELPAGKHYDYIVVGAGTAGGTVATRLSEDSTKNVLVIEAGIDPSNDINTQVPLLAAGNFHGPEDWNFTTTPQSGLNGRSIEYPRGRALGGSSTLQLMVWNRGGSDDYDRWAELTGNDAWSWNKLLPYFKKTEHPSPDTDMSKKWLPAFHGHDGPLGITVSPWPLGGDERLLNTTQELPDIMPFNPDFSAGNSLGFSWLPSSIEHGARASSWTHFMRPNIGRPNLDIVINTRVTRLVQTGIEDGKAIFRGVEWTTGPSEPRATINATREVILSTGAIQTPQILMLSGIGDPVRLGPLGIKAIVENSHVGEHLQDHPLMTNIFKLVDDANTLDDVKRNATLRAQYLEQWKANGTGPAALAGPKQMGFFRNPTVGAPFNTSVDPSAGPTTGHFQMGFENVFLSFVLPTPATGKYFSIITNVISPSSFGSVSITSDSVFDAPVIDPGILGTYYDLATMREGIKTALKLMASKSMTNNFIVEPYGPLKDAAAIGTDEAYEQLAANTTTTVWHPSGSARMSIDNTGGVLDSECRVFGTIGLRVVDASAMPRIPASNIQTGVYVIAERAADFIKAAAR